MIGYYLCPIIISNGGKTQAASIREGVSRMGAIRSVRCIASIPVDPVTGIALHTWTLVRVQGADFTALDADTRVERLALDTELDVAAVPATLGPKLTKFGLGGISTAGMNRAVINRVGSVLTPGFRIT